MYKEKLKKHLDTLPDGPTRNQVDAKVKASEDYVIYATEAFCGTDALHPTAKDAALYIQCDPYEEFSQESGFTRLKSTCGKCSDCRKYERPRA